MAVGAPSQVFMADIDAPTIDEKGQDDDSNKHRDTHLGSRTNDQDKTSPVTVTLGAVGTIPKKVYKVLEHNNHRSDEPESSKRPTSGMAKEDHHVERIYLSKEAIARVKDAVKHGTNSEHTTSWRVTSPRKQDNIDSSWKSKGKTPRNRGPAGSRLPEATPPITTLPSEQDPDSAR